MDNQWLIQLGSTINHIIADVSLQACAILDGTPCLFPFRYGGKSYNGCNEHKREKGEVYRWCATAVSEALASGPENGTWVFFGFVGRTCIVLRFLF